MSSSRGEAGGEPARVHATARVRRLHISRDRGGVRRGDAERREQIRLVRDRVPRPQLARRRSTGRCTSSCGRESCSRSAARAPVTHVSHELRGPPWKSITRSKRAARSLRPSRTSSRTRRRPRVRSMTITSSRWGLSRDDRAAAPSTRYVRRAPGKRRRSARMAGVVNTTSPTSRRRMSRMFIRRPRGPYGSIVASSISITGMSSLIG